MRRFSLQKSNGIHQSSTQGIIVVHTIVIETSRSPVFAVGLADALNAALAKAKAKAVALSANAESTAAEAETAASNTEAEAIGGTDTEGTATEAVATVDLAGGGTSNGLLVA